MMIYDNDVIMINHPSTRTQKVSFSNLPSARGFLQDVQKQYHRIPYHNSIHAADVLSSCTYFLREDLFGWGGMLGGGMF